jgi:hypothetical protein
VAVRCAGGVPIGFSFVTVSGWAAWATAAGTFAVAVAAVWVALWTNRRTVRRIREERRVDREREQLAEAYKVQVVQGERPAGGQRDSSPSVVVLVASVCNRGPYTITGVEVQFSPDGQSLVGPRSSVRVSSFADLPAGLRKPGDSSEERAMRGVLTPWDTGMRSETDPVGVQTLKGNYALVRWTDRRGTRWEHRLGKVRRIRDDEPWTP